MGGLISTKHTEDHMNNTRHSIDLHLLFSRLSRYQKGTFYMGIRILNSLPFQIKAPVMINSSKEPSPPIHSVHYRNILT